ncbi:MAG: hypothetical protein LQ346_007214 [Caloplaca aetnensis]|nr:MAG: hypothetical protein LQ346_007214 [Caloplaca aetnensis]
MRVTRAAAAKQAELADGVGKENKPQELAVKRPTAKKAAAVKTQAVTKSTTAKAIGEVKRTKVSTRIPAREVVEEKVSTTAKSKRPAQRKSKANETESEAATAKVETIPTTKSPEKPSGSATAGKKRKRSTAPKVEQDADELPHGLGKLWKPSGEDEQMASTTAAQAGTEEVTKSKEFPSNVAEPTVDPIQPHVSVGSPPAKKKRAPRGKAMAESEGASAPVADTAQASATDTAETKDESPTKKSPRKKANPYGLTPGVTPYPEWAHPTPKECEDINELLSSIHGKVTPPEKIPPPSETVAGCGEVPCVLDALIRTYLSSATTGKNSSSAFQGLINEYGKQTSGIGQGSVNWNAVRLSPVERVFKAIHSGGLAANKSKNIKAILDMVYEENQARRARLLAAKEQDNDALLPAGAKNEGEAGQAAEIARANDDILSLDHLHAMGDQDVFFHMLNYPGIGVKTASCVSLFCLRRPSFAVDTHVFRLCQWLGWVPPTATRDKTFMHCEVRIPDELKYPLHQLFIMHGKKCPRCRAITGESSEGWDEGCVIDHLVTRTGVRKGGDTPVKGKGQGKKRKKSEDEDEDEEEEEEDLGERSEDGGSGYGTENEVSPTKTKVQKTTKTTPKKTPTNKKATPKKEVAFPAEPPADSVAAAPKSKKGKRKSSAIKTADTT